MMLLIGALRCALPLQVPWEEAIGTAKLAKSLASVRSPITGRLRYGRKLIIAELTDMRVV